MKVELLTDSWHLRSAYVPTFLSEARGYGFAVMVTMRDLETKWGTRPQTVLIESKDEMDALLAEATERWSGLKNDPPADGALLRDYLDVRQVLVRLA